MERWSNFCFEVVTIGLFRHSWVDVFYRPHNFDIFFIFYWFNSCEYYPFFKQENHIKFCHLIKRKITKLETLNYDGNVLALIHVVGLRKAVPWTSFVYHPSFLLCICFIDLWLFHLSFKVRSNSTSPLQGLSHFLLSLSTSNFF